MELLLSNDQVDTIAGEIDVAMRVGTLADSNLAARKLAVFHTAIYATPGYIARFGEPLHPDDLIHHRATVQGNHRAARGFVWSLQDGSGQLREFPVDPIVIASDPNSVRPVMLDGEGMMLTSDVCVWAFVEQGLMQRVLAGWHGVDVKLHALFPRGQVQSPNVRAFVDFLVDLLHIEQSYLEVWSGDALRGPRPASAVEVSAVASEQSFTLQAQSRPKAASGAALGKGRRSRTDVKVADFGGRTQTQAKSPDLRVPDLAVPRSPRQSSAACIHSDSEILISEPQLAQRRGSRRLNVMHIA